MFNTNRGLMQVILSIKMLNIKHNLDVMMHSPDCNFYQIRQSTTSIGYDIT